MYVKKEGISVNVCAGIGAVGGAIGGLAFDFVVQTFAGMLDHNYHYSLNMYSSLAFGGLGTVAGAVAGTTAGVHIILMSMSVICATTYMIAWISKPNCNNIAVLRSISKNLPLI